MRPLVRQFVIKLLLKLLAKNPAKLRISGAVFQQLTKHVPCWEA